MFDGFDPADLLGLRSFARPGLVLDPGDPINRTRTGTWPLNDPGNATALDISGFGRHAAQVNNPSSVTGPFGPAKSFSSTSYMVAQDRADLPLLSTYTYSLWMRGSGTLPNYAGAYAKTKATNQGQASLSHFGGTLVVYHDTAGGSWDTGISLASVFDGKWHLVTIGYSGGVSWAWRDGVLITSSTYFYPPDTGAGDLKIGNERTGGSGYGWQNPLALMSEWRRLLSSQEVARLFREPFAGIISEDDRLYMPKKGASTSGVTVALTGIAPTFSAGTLLPTRDLPLTGSAGTFAAGTLAPATSLALTGGASTLTAGTVTPEIGAAISGSAATAAAGTVAYASGLSLSGAAATPAAGTLAIGLAVAIAGSALTLSAGSVAYSASFSLTGIASTGAGGTVGATGGDVETIASITGIRIRVLPGNVKVTGGTRWRPQAPAAVVPPSMAGNTLQGPPRLTGNAELDTRAIQQWLQTLYDRLVKEANALGRLADHESRIAALEANPANDNAT